MDNKRVASPSIASLRHEFLRMSEDLAVAAESIRDPGVPPSEDLVQRLTSLRTDFDSLVMEYLEDAASLAFPATRPENLSSLEAVMFDLIPLKERSGRILRSSEVLRRFLRLRTEFDGFMPFRRRAEQDLAAIESSDSEEALEAVEARLPDLKALLELVEHVPVDRVAKRSAHGRITDSFSSEIAFEALDGGFTLTQETVPPRDAGPDRAEASCSTPVEASEQAIEEPSSWVSEAVPESVEHPPAGEDRPSFDAVATEVDGSLAAATTLPESPVADVTPSPESEILLFLDHSSGGPPVDLPTFHDEAEPSGESTTSSPPTEEPVTPTSSPVFSEPCSVSMASEEKAWRLAVDGRTFIAATLLRALQGQNCPQANLLEAAALAPYLQRADGPIAAHLRRLFEKLVEMGWSPEDSSENFLLMAATLRSSLLSPDILFGMNQEVQLDKSLPNLSSLLSATRTASRPALSLNSGLLKGRDALTSWENEMIILRESIARWRAQAQGKTSRFARATWVWQSWVSEKGFIGGWLEAVGMDEPRVEEIGRELEKLRLKPNFRKKVRETESEVDPAGARLNPIDGPALNDDLYGWTEEALDLLKEWVTLWQRHPGLKRDFAVQTAYAYRQEAEPLLGRSVEELEVYVGNGCTKTKAATGLLCSAINDLAALLSPDTECDIEEPVPTVPAFLDLLRVPGLRLDFNANPKLEAKEVAQIILDHDQNTTWEEAFFGHLESSGFVEADRILRLAQVHNLVEEPIREAMKKARVEADKEARQGLDNEVRILRGSIDRATGIVLSDQERQALLGRLETLRSQDSISRLSAFREEVRAMNRDIETRLDSHESAFRARMKRQPLAPHLLQRIESALLRHDLLMANALIETPDLDTVFENPDDTLERFMGFLLQVERELARQSLERLPSSTIKPILAGEASWGPLSLGNLSVDGRSHAESLWTAWELLRFGNLKDHIPALLRELGIGDPKIRREIQAHTDFWSGDVLTTPLANRRLCPIPRFGSQAKGLYYVVCLRKPGSPQEILARLPANKPALVVFYLGGILGAGHRRELSLLCRKQSISLLLVDEALVLFLLSTPTDHVRSLFYATLPFSHDNPYVLSGPVAPEMFFGRTQERKSIVDANGTNLVFGGRQLGKTALLCDIEMSLKDDPDIICRWLDLKAKGIGVDRPPEDIWPLFADLLHEVGVLGSNRAGQETMRKEIQAWLQSDHSRRILFLLDEADGFLEKDSLDSKYGNLCPIKDLMTSTGFRFKVVFAGLHNVQRTSRNPNTPLAHLREPIAIGPFLLGPELCVARDLVELPLRALGYQPDSPDVAIRILSLANFYPSLIQVFCHYLIRHVETRILRSGAEGPPWRVTTSDVDSAYQEQQLRQQIRDRLRWTLRLDNRYQVIALSIMHESLSPASPGLTDGFSLETIQKEALSWWEKGFRRTTAKEDFRTLLDEMVGLGILRKVSQDQYALRSPNVLHLFGAKEDIANAITDAASEEPPAEYEAQHFHRTLNEALRKRSPLTAVQEGRLLEKKHDVTIFFGVPAAGIADVRASLESLSGVEGQKSFNGNHHGAFKTWLEGLSFPDKGLHLYLIGPEANWTPAWVGDALQTAARFTSRQVYRRFVFIGGPDQAWKWVSDPGRFDGTSIRPTVFSLAPWSEEEVRRWMNESEKIPTGRGALERLVRETGGWPEVIVRFSPKGGHTTQEWEAHQRDVSSRLRKDPSLLDAFGLRGEVRKEMAAMVDYGESVSAEELAEVADGLTVESTERALRYAELLNLVRMSGPLGIPDPWVSNFLLAHGERV